MKPWWEQFEGLLEYELSQLDAAGITYKLDEDAKKRGTIVLTNIRVTLPDGRIIGGLKAVFPDLYPFFRFELFSDALSLGHHQNPLNGALCLINRGTHNWSVNDTLAGLIQSQLYNTIKTGESESKEEVIGLEDPQADPIASFIPCQPNHGILIDPSWKIPDDISKGLLEIGIENTPGLFRGAVLSVTDDKGKVIATGPDYLNNRYKNKVRGRWVRDNKFEVVGTPAAMLTRIKMQTMDMSLPRLVKFHDICIEIIGVHFQDEYQYREKNWSGWVFIIRMRPQSRNKAGSCTDSRLLHPEDKFIYVKAFHLNDQLMNSRIPARQSLATKKIAVIGLGCLGAQSTIELAKAGAGELRILDHDIVEPGTTVRWPMGLQSVGFLKTHVISNFIAAHYPQTNVTQYQLRIGTPNERRDPNCISELALIDHLLTNVDLIYDASAEIGIQYALSTLGKERRIPYIGVSTTHGCWGGLIFRIRPGITEGCYSCLQAALKDKTIPTPATDINGEIQPLGCDAPTYTGPAFDAGEILLGGVRFVVSTLTAEDPGGYPCVDWDVAVINLRTPEGASIPPSWSVFSLKKHPDCPVCSYPKE